MNTIICRHCDMVSELPDVKMGYVAKCPRCHRTFYKTCIIKPSKMFALAITALMVSIPAFTFPLISIHLLGITEGTNLLQGAMMMIDIAPLVSFVVLFCAVICPILLTFCMAYSSTCMMLNIRPAVLAYVLKLTSALVHWSMLEVYLISLFVAIFKLMNYADLYFGSGLYFFIALLIINMTMISEYNNKKYWEYLRNGKVDGCGNA